MHDVMLRRTGWVMLGLFALFMLGASVAPKLLGLPIAAQTMADLGWPAAPIVLIGVLELICTALVLFPPTGQLGGILMMAILGGAMVTQMRAGTPLVSNQLFSVWLGLWMWAGLWARDGRLRAVLPWTR
jgi:hypothetical protein